MVEYECLVISGGATKGMISLGVMSKHWDELKGVKTLVGTSVGAVICTLFSMGLSVEEIYDIGSRSRPNMPTGFQWVGKLVGLFTNLGLLSYNGYLDRTREKIMEKYGFIPTMKQLYDITGKDLLICVSAILRRTRIIISHNTYPDLSVIDALDMSTRLPIIFSPILFENDLCVDGGIVSHFPIDLRVGHTLAINTINHVPTATDILSDSLFLEYVTILFGVGSPIDLRPINGTLYHISYKKNRVIDDEFRYMFEIGKNATPHHS
jgi:predicted acylesterase/phospholipase RssA